MRDSDMKFDDLYAWNEADKRSEFPMPLTGFDLC